MRWNAAQLSLCLFSLPILDLNWAYYLVPSVILRSLLTSLQLIHVPPTDIQIPLVLIHALREHLDVAGARTLVRLRGTAVAVVVAVVGHRSLLSLGSWSAG